MNLMRLRRRNGVSGGIEEAGDMEELLSAFERELALLLTGGERSCLGRDEAVEMMAEEGMPLLLQRRVHRLWKDLEQALAAGRESGGPLLEKMKPDCLDAIEEARRSRR